MFKRIAKTFGILAVAALATACVNETASSDEPVENAFDPVSMPEHDAMLIVQLLNSPSTTLTVLDDEVGLNRSAATELIATRNGKDNVYPSADDHVFHTIADVDAVRYVGSVALEQLRAYAIAHAPAGPELVEGVEFTSEQVTAIVWGVNQATVEELDQDVGLLRTAAEALVASGPYTSVSQMGDVSYVGPAALRQLRDHAVLWSTEMGGDTQTQQSSQGGTYDGVSFDGTTADAALAISNTATLNQLMNAGGMTSSGAHSIVDGRPFATLRDVSDTYGVGPATMQDLHDYAASGTF